MSTVMVPVRLVNVMREVLVEEVANCAEEIKDSGHSHPDFGIDPQELEDFRSTGRCWNRSGRYAPHRRSRSS
jgi:hypothetical protein